MIKQGRMNQVARRQEVKMSNSNLKTLPIGISDWSQLRQRGMFFVDKTEKLRSLVVAKNKIFLSRPRRMGKSMLCSMLEDLFNNGVRNFEGTAIYAQWPEQAGTYPVIRITFVDIDGDTKSEFEQSLIGALVDAYSSAGFPEVAEYEKEYKTLDRFLKALKSISRKYELVFLIDEWDHPLSANLGNETKYNIALSALKRFYSWMRAIDSFRFILVTGIMRYSSASLFTGQDIRDISMDPEYASLVGYTHEELVTNYAPYIQATAQTLGLSEAELIAELQAYYDGFCFDERAEVKLYSPWDINQFFERVTPEAKSDYHPEFKAFWMNSSNAAHALREFLSSRPTDLEALCQLKYDGINLTTNDLATPVNFAEVTISQLLAESGYLTIKSIVSGAHGNNKTYHCGLPNLEVLEEFDQVLMRFLSARSTLDVNKVSALKTALKTALLQGAIKDVCALINELLSGVLSDTFKFPHEPLYRTLIAGWLRDVADEVREETPSYQGRSDIELKIGDKFYVFELKLIHNITKNDGKRALKARYGLLKAATEQIIAKGYAVNHHSAGQPVIGVALVLSNKRRCIAAWHMFERSGGSCGRTHTVNLFTKYLAEQAELEARAD